VEDSDVLRHLLKIEAEAAALAKDAAAEADKRVAEAEKQNRQRYDDAYTKEVASLEEKYRAGIAAVKIEYQRQLDDFAQSLDAMEANSGSFSELLERLLFEKFEKIDHDQKNKKNGKTDTAGVSPLFENLNQIGQG
jgi:regulator of protease activity HflC (stomatin/prohibitin superfamily)